MTREIDEKLAEILQVVTEFRLDPPALWLWPTEEDNQLFVVQEICELVQVLTNIKLAARPYARNNPVADLVARAEKETADVLIMLMSIADNPSAMSGVWPSPSIDLTIRGLTRLATRAIDAPDATSNLATAEFVIGSMINYTERDPLELVVEQLAAIRAKHGR
jgi:hypothetical protein